MKHSFGFFIVFFLVLQAAMPLFSQELYVYNEPASTLPARSVSVKLKNHLVQETALLNQFSFRTAPQVFLGMNKNLTIRLGGTLSSMYSTQAKLESYHIYAKYRFLSNDDIHRHFRMAGYFEAARTNAPFHYDEINLGGDRSGMEAGLILTQLWNKFALSGTISQTQVFHYYRWDKVRHGVLHPFTSAQFNLSAGYLVFPRTYTSYKQTNLNFYLELLTQRALDRSLYYVDLAPAMQLILASKTKLNIGYRFQLDSDMKRMMQRSWLLSLETSFLGALKRKTND
ncbi:MAG: hypothetical protein KGO80_04285 [Bacteroidetes bacterium]|jgi:hypothetical protein|nr:hypothetical protein [Bacteroidota bacterium]